MCLGVVLSYITSEPLKSPLIASCRLGVVLSYITSELNINNS